MEDTDKKTENGTKQPPPQNGTNLPAPATMKPSSRPMGGLIPTSLEELWRFGSMIFKSGFAPSGMKSPEAVCVAIQMGLEVGLSPMQAIQNIAVINGRPSIWGDAALGLVEASGLLEEFEEWEEGKRYTDAWTTFCKVRRRGRKVSIRSWTWEDARRAGLDKKTGPWKEYTQRMMQMRPRSWALRDNFADVLRGLSIREEAEDIIPMEQRQANGMYEATQNRLKDLRARLTPAPDPAPETDMAPPVDHAGTTILQPETVACPDKDGADVPVGQCATCESREDCPSHE